MPDALANGLAPAPFRTVRYSSLFMRPSGDQLHEIVEIGSPCAGAWNADVTYQDVV